MKVLLSSLYIRGRSGRSGRGQVVQGRQLWFERPIEAPDGATPSSHAPWAPLRCKPPPPLPRCLPVPVASAWHPWPSESRSSLTTQLKGHFLHEAVPDLRLQPPGDPAPRHLHICHPFTTTLELPTAPGQGQGLRPAQLRPWPPPPASAEPCSGLSQNRNLRQFPSLPVPKLNEAGDRTATGGGLLVLRSQKRARNGAPPDP